MGLCYNKVHLLIMVVLKKRSFDYLLRETFVHEISSRLNYIWGIAQRSQSFPIGSMLNLTLRGYRENSKLFFIFLEHFPSILDHLTGMCSRAGLQWVNRVFYNIFNACLLYTSPSPRDGLLSRMPSSA